MTDESKDIEMDIEMDDEDTAYLKASLEISGKIIGPSLKQAADALFAMSQGNPFRLMVGMSAMMGKCIIGTAALLDSTVRACTTMPDEERNRFIEGCVLAALADAKRTSDDAIATAVEQLNGVVGSDMLQHLASQVKKKEDEQTH